MCEWQPCTWQCLSIWACILAILAIPTCWRARAQSSWLPFACYVCRGLMDVAQLALFQCGWIAGSLAFDQQQSCIMSLDSSKSWFPERKPFSQSQYMRLCQFCAITLAAVWHKLIAIRYPLDICDVLRPRCHVIKIVQ